MALLKLHLTGFPGAPAGPEKLDREMMVNSDYIVVMDESHHPAGTRLRIQHVERDLVVRETMAEIENLISG